MTHWGVSWEAWMLPRHVDTKPDKPVKVNGPTVVTISILRVPKGHVTLSLFILYLLILAFDVLLLTFQLIMF